MNNIKIGNFNFGIKYEYFNKLEFLGIHSTDDTISVLVIEMLVHYYWYINGEQVLLNYEIYDIFMIIISVFFFIYLHFFSITAKLKNQSFV